MAELHDFSDDDYWRSLSPRDVFTLVSKQIDDAFDGTDYPGPPDPFEVIRQALLVVGVDIQDRAVDQSYCGKVDTCRGRAVFLAWLAWHLDDAFLARFARDAQPADADRKPIVR